MIDPSRPTTQAGWARRERIFASLEIPTDPIRAAATGELAAIPAPVAEEVETLSTLVREDSSKSEAAAAVSTTAGTRPETPSPPVTDSLPPAAPPPAPQPHGRLEPRAVYRRAKSAVVGIADGADVIGTGFFVRDPTLVVTNAHVVEVCRGCAIPVDVVALYLATNP